MLLTPPIFTYPTDPQADLQLSGYYALPHPERNERFPFNSFLYDADHLRAIVFAVILTGEHTVKLSWLAWLRHHPEVDEIWYVAVTLGDSVTLYVEDIMDELVSRWFHLRVGTSHFEVVNALV